MKNKVLYILSTYNLYGGTPKKTLDLMKYFGQNSILYVYENTYREFKPQFEKTKGKIFEGFYGKNLLSHLKHLLRIIDEEKIDIVQTQFFWGEVLGYLIKLFRPKINLIIAFVGPFKPNKFKSFISKFIYKKTDHFVYITKYVQNEKSQQFQILKRKNGSIIYNGSAVRIDNGEFSPEMKNISVFDIAGLVNWKNIQILIKAFNIIVNQYKKTNYYLYVAGDGPYRSELEKMIENYKLQNNVFLLGYQKNVGRLLNSCDIFVHPSFAEGFGIVVPEAMLAQKPVIVSNAGALPELIEHKKTGLIVESHNPEDWANAIIQLAENPEFAEQLAKNAEKSASERFSYNKFCGEYEKLYKKLLKINY